MRVPTKQAELLEKISRETARMSYPGSMSRGMKPVVTKGTKGSVEEYYATCFPMLRLWRAAPSVAATFERWHKSRVIEIAGVIEPRVSAHNNPLSVAAKFLNTFMHQLMKYEECRPVYALLHLPLDARVFSALSRIDSPSLDRVRPVFAHSPYTLAYEDHLRVQTSLRRFAAELNARRGAEFLVRSRVELNWLWV